MSAPNQGQMNQNQAQMAQHQANQNPDQPNQNQAPVQRNQSQITPLQLAQMAIELVSEIVSRTTEVCQLFKMLQFPNGTPMAKKISEDRRKRLTDVHTILVSHFRTLNAIHTRLQDLPDPNIRDRVLKELIPMVGDVQDIPITDETRELMRQKQELLQINESKNNQMIAIIKHLRLLVKDINIDAPLKPESR